MTTSLDTLVVPVRYYTALDPYNWKVDNRPISDLEDNDDVLRSGIETTLNAIKVGATVDGRILRSLVGLNKASGDWVAGPGISLIVDNAIMVVEKPDDGYLAVDVIATQYSQQVFTFSAPTAGYKKLITISAGFNLPLPANMPYFDSTQSLDALMLDFTTAQTKQGTMDYEVLTNNVALSDPDTYLDPSLGNKKLFQIKVLDTDTSLTIGSVDPVGITKHGQAVAKANQAIYGQVRFATGTEVTEGTSTDTVVSPADLKSRIDAIPTTLPGSYYLPGAILVQPVTSNPEIFRVDRIGSGRVTIRGIEYLVQEGTTFTPSVPNTMYAVYLVAPVFPNTEATVSMLPIDFVATPSPSGSEPRYDPAYGQVYRFANTVGTFTSFLPELFLGVVYHNTAVNPLNFINMFYYYGRSFLNDRGTFSGGFQYSADYYDYLTVDMSSTRERTDKNGKVNLEAVMIYGTSAGTAHPWGTGDEVNSQPLTLAFNTSSSMTVQPNESRATMIGAIAFPFETTQVTGTASIYLAQPPDGNVYHMAVRLVDTVWVSQNGPILSGMQGWCLCKGQISNVDASNDSYLRGTYSLTRRHLNNERITFLAFDTVADITLCGLKYASTPAFTGTSIQQPKAGVEGFMGIL